MATIPDNTLYRWTPQDYNDAHSAKGSLTPYALPRTAIPDAKTLKPGDYVDIPLANYKSSLTVGRFSPSDDLDWSTLPADAQDQGSLADLCASLKGKGAKFPDRYYDISSMSLMDRHDYARLLFEHWDNTDYRYAVIQSGKFSWSFLQETQDTLKLLPVKATYRDAGNNEVQAKLKSILTTRVGAGASAGGPGPSSQAVVLPDATLDQIDPDIVEISWRARRIGTLLKLSATAIADRVTLARSVTALRTLIESCAGGSNQANRPASLIGDARDLDGYVGKALSTLKTRELLEKGGLDPALEKAVRSALSFTDDMAAEIETHAIRLRMKLMDDTGFAARGVKFLTDALNQKLVGTAGFNGKQQKLVDAVVEALGSLRETKTPDDFPDKLFEILKRVPDSPVLQASDVKQQTPLDVVVSIAHARPFVSTGIVAQILSASAGNLAGPPSLIIALHQSWAWFSLQKAIKSGDPKGMKTVVDRTVATLNKALRPNQGLKDQLAHATDIANKNGQAELVQMKQKLLDEYTATKQSSASVKSVMVCIQILALAMAFASLGDDVRDPNSSKVVVIGDILGILGELTSLGVSVMDASIEILKTEAGQKVLSAVAMKLPWTKVVQATLAGDQLVEQLAIVGVQIGGVAAFFGAIGGLIQIATATTNLGRIAGGMAVTGNVAIMFAAGQWLAGTPVPYVQAAGVFLVVGSSLLMLGQLAADAQIPGPNRIAVALIERLRDNPYYLVLWGQQDQKFKTLMARLEAGCTYSMTDSSSAFPRARNNEFVVKPLVAVGFLNEHISLIVDPVGATLTPGLAFPQP